MPKRTPTKTGHGVRAVTDADLLDDLRVASDATARRDLLIRQGLAQGISARTLAEVADVSPLMVYRIVRGAVVHRL